MRICFLILLAPRVYAADLDVTTFPPVSAGYAEFRVKPTTLVPVSSVSDVKMRFTCMPAKTGLFDPIVYPGQSNVGHWHTFFGNTGISPLSDVQSIKNTGNSTCMGGTAMRSSYWVPSLYDTETGRYIAPRSSLIYYTTGTGRKEAQQVTQALPDGLVMIAGDMNNAGETSEEFKRRKIFFQCYAPGVSSAYTKSIPFCPKGGTIQVNISFRNCWDGLRLDSPDHKSHMSYGGNFPPPTYCPPSHPVRVADIGFNIFYPVTTESTQYWRFVSDMYNPALPGGYSVHADFMNGTADFVKKMLVENCFKAGKDCGMGLLGLDPVDGLFKRLY